MKIRHHGSPARFDASQSLALPGQEDEDIAGGLGGVYRPL